MKGMKLAVDSMMMCLCVRVCACVCVSACACAVSKRKGCFNLWTHSPETITKIKQLLRVAPGFISQTLINRYS